MAVNLIDSNDITITQTGEDITLNLANVDSTTSTSSTNPIQNQAITNFILDNITPALNNLMNYSTTNEKQIGYWIDGKPLYRVVVSTTTPSSSSVAAIATIAGLNYNEIISLNGMLYTSSQSVPLIWLYTSSEINSLYVEGNNIMCKITASSYQSKTCYVILEYTKTTD